MLLNCSRLQNHVARCRAKRADCGPPCGSGCANVVAMQYFFVFRGDFLVCAVPVARASVRTNGGRRHRGCCRRPTCRGVRGPLAATVLSLTRKMTCAALRTGHCVTFTAGRLRICARDTVKGICVVITVEAPEARTNWNVVPASYVPAGSMA